jgi:hypothetical protein
MGLSTRGGLGARLAEAAANDPSHKRAGPQRGSIERAPVSGVDRPMTSDAIIALNLIVNLRPGLLNIDYECICSGCDTLSFEIGLRSDRI